MIVSIVVVFMLCLFTNASAEVLFSDNFDALDDWTVTQPTATTCSYYGGSGSCNPNTAPPGSWTGYYNGACKNDGVSGEPGNNLMYIDQYAGYPLETNTCRGGSGKCLTFWSESGPADWADGQLDIYLAQEYSTIYLRWYIRYKNNFELEPVDVGCDGKLTKLYHIQHYVDGPPHAYFDANRGNQPVGSGGITDYGCPDASKSVYFYAENRCQQDYYCHDVVWWELGSISWARAAGGIYDGDWHSMEIRMTKNSTPGTADGVIQFWFDGTQKTVVAAHTGRDTSIEYNDNTPVCDDDSGALSGDPCPGGDGDCGVGTCDSTYEDRGFSYISIFGNTSNEWDDDCADMDDCEQWYAVDDVVVSTTYIGTDAPAEAPMSATGCVISGGTIQ